VGAAFFPLDEELGLGAERLTPHAHECLVRFGAWMPFQKAAAELAFSLCVVVSEPTARRYAQAAGEAYVDWQTAEVERLERETPEPPAGPEKMFFSVDGAMVPLVGGEWTEVKTMTLGEIPAAVLERGEWVVHSQGHSYFSRVTEASRFRRLALAETHRRGVERAGQIAAVTDGAEWEQGFIDFHCPQAVRILDFPHAAERVSAIGQALWGLESEATQTWLGERLHGLKQEGSDELLAELAGLRTLHPESEVVSGNLAYLEKREAHMQYPQYQAQGLPIASGAMESGNKVVVEARLKGADMHWALHHVNPMLALRNILCSDRWEEAWPHILTGLRQAQGLRKKERRTRRREEELIASALVEVLLTEAEGTASQEPDPPAMASQLEHERVEPPIRSKSPAPNHPWRRSPIGRATFWPSNHFSKN
jgi:hypothetical protein